MVRFLINTTFWGAALIRKRQLLEGDAYSDLSGNGAALLEGDGYFRPSIYLRKYGIRLYVR